MGPASHQGTCVNYSWFRPTSRVISVRGLRSFTQAYLNIITPLYLLSRGVSSTGLGLLYTFSFLIGAFMAIPIGVFADRIGRKPFLIAFTVLMFIWGIVFSHSTDLALLISISAISGIGRGGGDMSAGAPGPFGPAELALLADLSSDSRRAKTFSMNTIVSSLMAAAGAFVAVLPGVIGHSGIPFVSSNNGLFSLAAVFAVISLLIILSLPEPPRKPREMGRRAPLTRKSTGLMAKQSLAGASNAIGMGFINSLFVVWLHLRFGVGQTSIGPVYTLSYLLSAAMVWGASIFARRFGSVRTVVISRLMAASLMVAIALSPTFFIAVLLQIIRISVTMMATPIRQAFTLSMFPPEERGSAAGLSGVIRRLAGTTSPPVAGLMFEAGDLQAPFIIGAVFQVLSGVIYHVYFGDMERSATVAESEQPAEDAESETGGPLAKGNGP